MSGPFDPKPGRTRMITAENAHQFPSLTQEELAAIRRDGGMAIMDGRAALQLMTQVIHDGEASLRAFEWLNRYCALARERGAPESVLRRLKEAAFQDGGGKRFLRWLDRAAKYYSENDFLLTLGGKGGGR
jgi:hypothetical protein